MSSSRPDPAAREEKGRRMRRQRQRCALAAIVAALLLCGVEATLAQESAPAPGRTVSADERLGDILGPPSPREASAPTTTGTRALGRNSGARDSSVSGVFLRMIGWTAVVVAVGAAIVLLLKRYTAFGRQLNGGGAIRVVGRTALSPKHSIFLVRLGNQRLLAVGVSGDRMVTLSEIEDPAGILACDSEFRSSLESYEGEGRSDGLASGREAELLPYQQEIRRVRGLLGSWRGLFQRGGASARMPEADPVATLPELGEATASMKRGARGETLGT